MAELSPEGKPKSGFKGFLKVIGIIIALIILYNVLVPSKKHKHHKPPSPQQIAESEKEAAVKLADCKRKMEKAQELEILYNLKFEGERAVAYVGSAWFNIPIDVKEGFHNTLQCFLTSGKGGAWLTLEYRHWQTGNVVAKTTYMGDLEVTP